MKQIFLLVFLLSFFIVNSPAQDLKIPIDSATGSVHFKQLITVDSASADMLYSKSKEWFAVTFKSADAVIQMDDKSSGKIIGKAYSDISLPPIMGITVVTRLYYTVSVSVKNGKCKIEFTDIYYKSYPDKDNGFTSTTTYPSDWYLPLEKMYKKDGSEKKINKGYYDQTYQSITSMIDSFDKHIKKTDSENEEDW